MLTTRYDTTMLRIVLALAAGALAGAFVTAFVYFWGTVRVNGFQSTLDYGLGPSLLIFIYAFAVWAIGLIVFSLPFWWVLHKFQLRHWLVAAVLGAAVTFFVSLGIATRGFDLIPPSSSYSASDVGGPTIVDGRLTPHGWWAAVQSTLMLSILGVFVVLVVWRVAYRKVGATRVNLKDK
jgi:hypothetical protein